MEAAQTTNRIHVLDILRGIALLGLLPMNILSFSNPLAAYFNPNAFQGDSWVTHISHAVTHLLFDQKMMGMFSFLFGVSVYLLAVNNEKNDRSPSMNHYARNFWLMVIGFLHATFIWSGDILFVYALLALVLYPFRYLPAAICMVTALVLYIWGMDILNDMHAFVNSLNAQGQINIQGLWSPSADELKEEVDLFLADYSTQLMFRIDEAHLDSAETEQAYVVLNQYVILSFIRAFALMLVGVAFAKWRFWEWAELPRATQLEGGAGSKSFMPISKLSTWLVLIGWLITGVGLFVNYAQHWQMNWGLGYGLMFNWIATPIIVLGYVLFIVSVTENWDGLFKKALANVGRMALTNYLLQSILMTSLFYGFGFSQFGQLDRFQLMLVVICVWLMQMSFSVYWLSKFRFGPVEWLWRLLTRFKIP